MKRTQRGFAIYTEFIDTYGNNVRVQRSSNAEKRHCWIFCDNPDDGKKIDADGHIHKSAPHLNIAQAKRIIKALQSFVNGKE